MKPTYGYDGLRARPKFDNMVEFRQYQQPFIKYTDRRAKQLRQSPYLTQLDGEGCYEMQEQQEKAMKEQEIANAIRRYASQNKETASLLKSDREAQTETAPETMEVEPPPARPTQSSPARPMEASPIRLRARSAPSASPRVGRRRGGLPDDDMEHADDEVNEAIRRRGTRRDAKAMADLAMQFLETDFTGGRGRSRSPVKKEEKKEEITPAVKVERSRSGGRKRLTNIKQEPGTTSTDIPTGTGLSSSSATAPETPRPTKRAKARAKSEEVSVGNMKINRSNDMEYSKQQSSNELKMQIAARMPPTYESRIKFQFKTKQESLDYIRLLITNGVW